jgi:hypothetical protein
MKHWTWKILGTFIFTLLLEGCFFDPPKDITGKWLMLKVLQEKQDVTSDHDPFDERFIFVRSDSTFESGGRPYGSNTGKYVYDPENQILYLDSDAGPEDDSQWKVSIQGDTMFWHGYGSEWADDFEIIHLREK